MAKADAAYAVGAKIFTEDQTRIAGGCREIRLTQLLELSLRLTTFEGLALRTCRHSGCCAARVWKGTQSSALSQDAGVTVDSRDSETIMLTS
jgi:hypothetical protein